MAGVLLVIFLAVYFRSSSAELPVSVDNGTHLVDLLCEQNHQANVTMTLNHSLSYRVTVNSTCIVNVRGYLTIESDSDVSATVYCDGNYIGAFGFIDVNISMSNVQFIRCGDLLSHFDKPLTSRMNSSMLIFTSNHSGIFVFINCSVIFKNVAINFSDGFAIIGLNLRQSQFINMIINNSNTLGKIGSGSGVLFLYCDIKDNVSAPEIHLLDCSLILNCVFYPDNEQRCIPSGYFSTSKQNSIISAGALTIIFSKLADTFSPLVKIENTIVRGNYGSYGGGVMVLMLNAVKGRVKVITSHFEGNLIPNNSSCSASALKFFANNHMHVSSMVGLWPLEIIKTNFSFNRYIDFGNLLFQAQQYGTIDVYVCHSNTTLFFLLKETMFYRNVGQQAGSCLTVISSFNAKVVLESVNAIHNRQSFSSFPIADSGLFFFYNVHEVIINGSDTLFSQNSGSCIRTVNSHIILSGNVSFVDNQAINGAALNMDNCVLYLNNPRITFRHNSANKFGGAIYITHSAFVGLPKCALQFNVPDPGYISFHNNTAGLSGNSIYGFPIYNCYMHGEIISDTAHYSRYLHLVPLKAAHLEISTDAYRFKCCANDCQTEKRHFYAGETFHFHMAAYDQARNCLVYSKARVYLHGSYGSSFQVSKSEKVQVIHESAHSHCSIISITIVIPKGYGYKHCYLYLSPMRTSIFSSFKLYLDPCPPGFKLQDGICVCSKAVNSFFYDSKYNTGKCDIKHLTISKPPEIASWIGVRSDTNDTVITNNCPVTFCRQISETSSFIFNKTLKKYMQVPSANISQVPTDLCRQHRVGVMCGSCEDNYSVVFGSDDCKQCSNKMISSLIVYIIAGPLLLFVMYCLKLTLTAGTLNGIIFFAQASNAGLLQSVILFDNSRFVTIFLSFLNFNVGYPVCFFNGMNELWKSGLTLVFPVYLLIIVVAVIVLSNYSSRLSSRISRHSVQVLVTIVHLSVSRLLSTIIDVVIPTKAYSDNGTFVVWNRNGSVEYLSTGHAVLFGITVSVVCIVLLPYMVMLLIGKQCLRYSVLCNMYCRPVVEAIYAPYKQKKEYWFVVQILFILLLYFLYAIMEVSGRSMLFFTITVLLSLVFFGQAFLHPMKSKVSNAIDCLILFDAAVCYFVLFLIYKDKESSNNEVMIGIFIGSIYVVVVLFVGILSYHVIAALRRFEIIKKHFVKFHVFKRSMANLTKLIGHSQRINEIYDDDYREPLLHEQ